MFISFLKGKSAKGKLSRDQIIGSMCSIHHSAESSWMINSGEGEIESGWKLKIETIIAVIMV